MFKCSDGGLFEGEQDAKNHEAKLSLETEVDEFLADNSSMYNKSAQRDLLIAQWDNLKKYFTKESIVYKEIVDNCIDGLMVEYLMHKQYYFEKILSKIVDDIEETKKRFNWSPSKKPELKSNNFSQSKIPQGD